MDYLRRNGNTSKLHLVRHFRLFLLLIVFSHRRVLGGTSLRCPRLPEAAQCRAWRYQRGKHCLVLKSLLHVTDLLVKENILIDFKGNARVADFGLSSYEDQTLLLPVPPSVKEQIRFDFSTELMRHGYSESMSSTMSSAVATSTIMNLSGAGTRRWMAPERLLPAQYGRESARATFEGDVFSYGMLLYQVGRLYFFPFVCMKHAYIKTSQTLVRVGNTRLLSEGDQPPGHPNTPP